MEGATSASDTRAESSSLPWMASAWDNNTLVTSEEDSGAGAPLVFALLDGSGLAWRALSAARLFMCPGKRFALEFLEMEKKKVAFDIHTDVSLHD
jgi:hypothetical protein